MSRASHDRFVGTRLTKEVFDQFNDKLERQDITQSVALREMINAYVEDRMKITPAKKGVFK